MSSMSGGLKKTDGIAAAAPQEGSPWRAETASDHSLAASPEVADFLPDEVPTQELPIDIIRKVRGHKFVKFDDRILVISATSRLVVAMIPRI
jgi:hypothetical protein